MKIGVHAIKIYCDANETEGATFQNEEAMHLFAPLYIRACTKVTFGPSRDTPWKRVEFGTEKLRFSSSFHGFYSLLFIDCDWPADVYVGAAVAELWDRQAAGSSTFLTQGSRVRGDL